MKNQNAESNGDTCKTCCHFCGKNIITTMVISVLFAACVSGGFGLWQNNNLAKIEKRLTSEVNSIKNSVNALQYVQNAQIFQKSIVTDTRVQATNQSSVSCSQPYNWSQYGITFQCPDDYYALIYSSDPELLFLSKSNTMPDGDISIFWTSLTIHPEKTLQKYLVEFSTEEILMQEKTMIGGREFTKLSIYSSFGNFTYTLYLAEVKGKLFELKVGKNEDALAYKVLESLQF